MSKEKPIEFNDLETISDISDDILKILKNLLDINHLFFAYLYNNNGLLCKSMENYEKAFDYMEAGSVPQLVLILADYQYKAAFVADREINTMAALTEIMGQLKFK